MHSTLGEQKSWTWVNARRTSKSVVSDITFVTRLQVKQLLHSLFQHAYMWLFFFFFLKKFRCCSVKTDTMLQVKYQVLGCTNIPPVCVWMLRTRMSRCHFPRGWLRCLFMLAIRVMKCYWSIERHSHVSFLFWKVLNLQVKKWHPLVIFLKQFRCMSCFNVERAYVSLRIQNRLFGDLQVQAVWSSFI